MSKNPSSLIRQKKWWPRILKLREKFNSVLTSNRRFIRDDVEKIVKRKFGFKFLDSGAYSHVFVLDKEYVLKISEKHDNFALNNGKLRKSPQPFRGSFIAKFFVKYDYICPIKTRKRVTFYVLIQRRVKTTRTQKASDIIEKSMPQKIVNKYDICHYNVGWLDGKPAVFDF